MVDNANFEVTSQLKIKKIFAKTLPLFPIYLNASPRQLIAEASVADNEFLKAPSKQDQTFNNLMRRLQRLEASLVVI